MPPPVTDLNTAHDEVAKQLGFNSYQDALTTLGTPSDDTTKFYNDAYSAAGLADLQGKINQRNADLNDALGKVNDNPWLDEASRVGRSRNLQTLAQGDIKNLQDQYDAGLKAVQTTVANHDKDVANNKAKLALLESQAKDLAAQATTQRKTASTAPTTIKAADGTTYQWNPDTKSFTPLFSSKTASTSTKPQQSDITSMNSQLSSVRGQDGYINPKDWATAKQAWVAAGYSSATFDSTFSAYKNPYDKYN